MVLEQALENICQVTLVRLFRRNIYLGDEGDG